MRKKPVGKTPAKGRRRKAARKVKDLPAGPKADVRGGFTPAAPSPVPLPYPNLMDTPPPPPPRARV